MAISIQAVQYQQPQVSGSSQARGTRSQIRQDVQELSTALQSGDLAGAQKSYGDLQKFLQSTGSISQAASTPPSVSTSSGPLSTIKNDFQALGQALSSGDLAGAQKDYAQLATDSQQVIAQQGGSGGRISGHHHHRHESPAQPANTDVDTVKGASTPATSTSSTAVTNSSSSSTVTTSAPSSPNSANSAKATAYQYSYQASFESVSSSTNSGGTNPKSNTYQEVSFHESFQFTGVSAPNTSTDPTSASNQTPAQQTGAYQFSYQASFQSVSYVG